MKRTGCIALALLGLACIAFAGRVYYLAFQEDLLYTRYSDAYWLGMPSYAVSAFPRIGMIGEEVFYSSCGDGPKLVMSGVSFASSAAPSAVWESVEEFLTQSGYRRDATHDLDQARSWIGPDSSVLVWVTEEEGRCTVEVRELFNL